MIQSIIALEPKKYIRQRRCPLPDILRQLLKIPRSKKCYYEIKELLRGLRFFLESFYFFFNRIARYAQSKESRNLLKNVAIKRVKSNA